MGLIHFPTPIPISGKPHKKFRGRKVRCIKQTSSNQPEDELLQGVRAFLGSADVSLSMSNRYLKSFIARQEKLSDKERAARRGYPSLAKAKRLQCAIEQFETCLKPVARSIGLKLYSDSAEYKSESSLA